MEKKIKIKHRKFRNASIMKFDNRRVHVEQLKDGSIGLVFKIKATEEYIKTKKPIPPSYDIVRGRVAVTKVKISQEAAFALFHALGYQLSNPIELPTKEQNPD